MSSFDEPLLHANLAAFSDPDPDRAFRFRPFVYGTRRRMDEAEALPKPVPPAARSERLRAGVRAAAARFVPRFRTAPVSACGPACC